MCYGLDENNYIVNADGTQVAGDLGDRLNNTRH
jgi:hypothetical protein